MREAQFRRSSEEAERRQQWFLEKAQYPPPLEPCPWFLSLDSYFKQEYSREMKRREAEFRKSREEEAEKSEEERRRQQWLVQKSKYKTKQNRARLLAECEARVRHSDVCELFQTLDRAEEYEVGAACARHYNQTGFIPSVEVVVTIVNALLMKRWQ